MQLHHTITYLDLRYCIPATRIMWTSTDCLIVVFCLSVHFIKVFEFLHIRSCMDFNYQKFSVV